MFLVISIAGTAITFLLHVFLARVMGPESYGYFAYAVNVMSILVLGGQLGYQHASIRFVSEYIAKNQRGLLKGFYQSSTRDIAVGSAATSALIIVGLEFWRRSVDIEVDLARSIQALAVLVPAVSFSTVWSGRLRGLKAVSASQVPTAIVQPICFGIVVLALSLILDRRVAAPDAILAYSIAAMSTFVLSQVFLRRRTDPALSSSKPMYRTSEWRRVATSFLAVTAVQIVRNRFVVLAVGFYEPAAEIGFFSSAKRVASLAAFGLTAVAAWSSPMIAEYHATGHKDRLQRLARIAAWCTTAFALPVTVIVLVFGREILGLFGEEFRHGYSALAIIALGQLVNSVTGPVGYLLTMTGHQRISLRIEAATAAVAVIVSLMLIPRFGLVGAALADACANVLRNLTLVVAAWRLIGVRSTVI